MPSRVQAQLAIDEEVIEDPELLSALEERLRAADDLAEIRGVYKTKNEAATAAIAKHEVPLGGGSQGG